MKTTHIMTHIKAAIYTYVPGGSGLIAALEVTDISLKVIFGALTIGWMLLRIIKAYRDLK